MSVISRPAMANGSLSRSCHARLVTATGMPVLFLMTVEQTGKLAFANDALRFLASRLQALRRDHRHKALLSCTRGVCDDRLPIGHRCLKRLTIGLRTISVYRFRLVCLCFSRIAPQSSGDPPIRLGLAFSDAFRPTHRHYCITNEKSKLPLTTQRDSSLLVLDEYEINLTGWARVHTIARQPTTTDGLFLS